MFIEAPQRVQQSLSARLARTFLEMFDGDWRADRRPEILAVFIAAVVAIAVWPGFAPEPCDGSAALAGSISHELVASVIRRSR